MDADRNLLFGLLAFQNNFITRQQLLVAFASWSSNQQKALPELLLAQQAITGDVRDLLSKLVEQHIKSRGDASSSIQSLTVDPDLRSQISMMAETQLLSPIEERSKPQEFPPTLPDLDRAKGERFLVVRPLDRGGLGIVSVAFDRQLNREVALKEIRLDRADDDRLRQKFVLEAEVTGGLEHPGIVPVYALGKADDGRPYYAMRLIRGDNLRRYIQKFHQGVRNGNHTFDGQELRRLLRRFLDVCEAISYAHARGVLHRDLKPSNIMLGPYGETLVVDWGLAKAMGVSGESDAPTARTEQTMVAPPETPLLLSATNPADIATIHGSIVGTPSYASPEQLAGNNAEVTTLSDVYGLGAILYELLTAQPPASGTLEEVIKDVTQGNIPTCRSIEAAIPKPLEAICHKALALKPNDRFPSARLLASEIERWLDDAPIETLVEPPLVRLRRWARNHPRTVSATTATATMLLVGSIAFASLVQRSNRQLVDLNKQLDIANQSLDQKNSQLQATNDALAVARDVAQQQSQLALSTLNAVVADIQSGLGSLPGSSRIRQRILSTSLTQLERVASEVVGKASVDRSTMLALGELGETIARFGTDERDRGDTQSLPSPVARTLIERSLQIAQTLHSENSKDAGTAVDLAHAHNRLGSIVLRLGDTPLAEQHFQQGLDLRQKLVKEFPDSWPYQRDLSYSFLRLGEVWMNLGKSQEASELFQRAADLLEQRTISHPLDKQAQRDLASALEKVSSAAVQLKNSTSAIQPLQAALAIREQLLEANSSSPSLQREALVANGSLADLLTSNGKSDEAAQFCQRAYDLSTAIHSADPNDLRGINDLANSLDRLARTNLKAGQAQLGIDQLEQSLAHRRSLLESDNTPFHTRQVAVTLDLLGRELQTQGRLADALTLLSESLDLTTNLVEQDPENLSKKRDLAISYLKIGDNYFAMRDSIIAQENYLKSKDIVDALLNEEPGNQLYQSDRLVIYSKMSHVQKALGNFKESLDYLQQGLRDEEAQLAADPQNRKILWNIAIWYEHIGDVQKLMEDYESALEHFRKSESIRTELALRNPSDQSLQLDRVFALTNIATVFITMGREADAIGVLEKSLEINRALVTNTPEDLELQQMLAHNYRHLAASHYALEQFEEAESARRAAFAASQKIVETTQQNEQWNQDHVNDLVSLARYAAQKSQWAVAVSLIKNAMSFLEQLPTTSENDQWRTNSTTNLQELLDIYQSQLRP